MAERAIYELLNPKVFSDGEFKAALRLRFTDDISRHYLQMLEEAEYGLSDSMLAKRIGVNRGQFTRYKSAAKQRPTLRNFCLRSAAADAAYASGAVIAFGAYCEAFRAVAVKIGQVPPPLTPEIACCLYFGFRRLRSELKVGRSGLSDAVCNMVICDVREYFPDPESGRRPPHGSPDCSPSSSPGSSSGSSSGRSPASSSPTIRTPQELRDAFDKRIDVWANVAFVLGASDEWF